MKQWFFWKTYKGGVLRWKPEKFYWFFVAIFSFWKYFVAKKVFSCLLVQWGCFNSLYTIAEKSLDGSESKSSCSKILCQGAQIARI